MNRRQFLGRALVGVAGLGGLSQIGCRSHQTAQVMTPGEPDMVGSHKAGSETFGPLVDAAVGRLLGRQSAGVQPAGFANPAMPQPMRICFIGVENRSAEEIGDFKDQLYQQIDTQIVQSQVYDAISRRFVEAGLRETRLRPDELMVPENMRIFTAHMEQMGQPFDYMLYATLTSGTTHDNKDYQRDYLLTLEMIDIHTGRYDKESAELRKGYNASAWNKLKNFAR